MGKLNENKRGRYIAVFLIMLLGLVLRFIFIWNTPYNVSLHDLGRWPTDDYITYYGHLGYTGCIFRNGALPDFDPRTNYATYNPPFHHLVSAGFLKVVSLLGAGEQTMLESFQFLTCFYSVMTMFVVYKILDKFVNITSVVIAGTALIAFTPFFIYSSGYVGNDTLAILFTVLTVYLTLRWFKAEDEGMLLLSALTLGLGMMTKLNVVLVAPAMAYLFLIKLLDKKGNKKDVKKLWSGYIKFLIVSVPLGTWWSFRNLILFKLPLGYLDEPDPELNQYIADNSIINRLIPKLRDFDHYHVSFDVKHKDSDTSVFLSAIKSSVTDDYNASELFSPLRGIAYVLLWIFIAVAVAGTVFFFINTVKAVKKKDHIAVFAVIGIVTHIVSYTLFCFRYPFICSESFRYICPVAVFIFLTFTVWQKGSSGREA